MIVAGTEQVPATIPSARAMDYKGKRLWAVPWNTWETQALRYLGFEVPSPIGTYYGWPRDLAKVPAPWNAQIETAAFFTLYQRGYCLNEIGTGKSLAALWASDWLMREGLIRKVLIMSPLSTLDRVWGDEVFTHLRHRNIGILYGSAEKRRRVLANDAYDFFAINHDALDIVSELEWGQRRAGTDPTNNQPVWLKVLKAAKLLRPDIDLVILDEAGEYRNTQTDRWKLLNRVLQPHMWFWEMTGTPIPNKASDAYGQIKLCTPDRAPKYYTEFRQMVEQQLTEYMWVRRQESTKIIFDMMRPSIRFKRSDCYDMPPCSSSTRDVPMSTEQKKHYKEMARQLYTEVKEGKVTAANEAVKRGKLLQIACGVVLDAEGKEREIDATPRLDALREIIRNTERKVIVFVPFTAALRMVARELEKEWTVAVVNGQVSKSKRDGIFTEFQHMRDPHILVADAGCMAHGLTLTAANTIVWWGAEESNNIYTQANGRITRASQNYHQHIIHLAGCAVERESYKRNEERGTMQGLLLDMVAKGMDL